MTPLQAIEAATATAPLTLGPQAPSPAGWHPATTPTSSPSTPIRSLTSRCSRRPEHITGVWTKGRRVTPR